MGGVGKHFQRKRRPRNILLLFGLVCTLIFFLLHIINWNMRSDHLSSHDMHEAQAPQRNDRGGNRLDSVRVEEPAKIEVNIKSPLETASGGDLKKKSRLDSKFKHLKTILYWNDAYGMKDFGFGFGQEPFIDAKCRVNTCYATHDKKLVAPEEADAIIWHLRAKNKSLPSERSPHTFYIFYVMESALYTYTNLNTYNGVFNWTMTYRLDSDFPKPYGAIKPPSSGAPARVDGAKNFAAGKTKLAAWFVSNCKTVSDREHLVRTLKKYIDIDLYGRCGRLKCPRNKHDECLKMLEKDYKFYFAFENSLCTDYITEKFFLPIKYDVVPVVYGLGHNKLGLPEHSYIDVLDFRSLRELADHLLYLDANDTAYNEYFRWKTMGYSVVDGETVKKQAFCDVCERLHEAHESSNSSKDNLTGDGASNIDTFRRPVIKESYRKVYTYLHQWFVAGKCTEPYSNRKLAAFVHGEEVSAEQIRAEEEELPYLLRPNKLP